MDWQINAEKKLAQGKENKSDEEFTKKNSRKKGPVIRRLSRPVSFVDCSCKYLLLVGGLDLDIEVLAWSTLVLCIISYHI